MASAMPDPRLPSQPQGITAPQPGTKLYCLPPLSRIMKAYAIKSEGGQPTLASQKKQVCTEYINGNIIFFFVIYLLR